ncbi:hypothetical protein OC834_007044 [Tilletia horrida]|nr:hypothetical protein OC834_007044 [Tilletia horrida]KAK0557022.1 hypothetical protein OC844_005689 [Tilletia horrida]
MISRRPSASQPEEIPLETTPSSSQNSTNASDDAVSGPHAIPEIRFPTPGNEDDKTFDHRRGSRVSGFSTADTLAYGGGDDDAASGTTGNKKRFSSAGLSLSDDAVNEADDEDGVDSTGGASGGKRGSMLSRPPGLESVEDDVEHAYAHHGMNDPNIDVRLVKQAEDALERGDRAAEDELEEKLQEDSIYPEVRAAVSNVDDPTMPVNTVRMWFMALIFTMLLTGLNQFFSFRYPSVRVSPLVIQLLAYPVGVGLAKILPKRMWKTPLGSFTLNPGPFNVKEHAMIVICANVNSSPNSATSVLAVQKFTYQQDFGAAYQILFVLSSQLLGFSFAGLCRRWLVWPAAMIWPATLVQTALLGTFHNHKDAQPGRMSREKFFLIAFVLAFAYYWFPGFIFTALSTFNWACWIAPNNVMLNQLMGVQSGLGMGLLTFDWGQITYLGSPLAIPWFASAQVLISYAFWFWLVVPIIYYTNTLNTAYLPILDNQVFDRFGEPYNVSKVLTPDFLFNGTAYNEYSQQYLTASFVATYGLQFAALAAIVVQVALWYGPTIYAQLRTSIGDEPDIHARLMSRYKEVPNYWYITTFFITIGLAFGCTLGWDTQHPWWALIVAVIISVLYILPIGIVYAITGLEIGLNVLSELIGGYMLKGRPVAVMIFKNLGYNVVAQAVSFVQDMKFGHYTKVPPRLMFAGQVISTIVGCFTVLGVQAWSFANIDGICTKKATDGFQCPVVTTSASSSIIWGLIGPGLNFSPGQMYANLLWFFLVGFVVPIPTYFYLKKRPNSIVRYVSWPVLFLAAASAAPASGPNFFCFALVGFIFQFYLRRRHHGWWSSYNYVLSAALDSGTGVAIVIIFFTVIFPDGANRAWLKHSWWGNEVSGKTLDAMMVTWRVPDPQTGFMPAPGGTKYAA